MIPRLKERYQQEVMPKLETAFGIKNRHAVPRLEKIVVSMGVGKAIENRKRVDQAVAELATIAGQRPAVTKARRSVSQFRLRAGMPIGAMVTLRGDRMYEFLDRLISIVIPRIRDFRGLNPNGFDGRGNYNMGLEEQSVFPEIDLDKVEFVQGLNIAIVVARSSDQMSRELLRQLGMPFRASGGATRVAG
jgi:large subunit ribosomal protein L5